MSKKVWPAVYFASRIHKVRQVRFCCRPTCTKCDPRIPNTARTCIILFLIKLLMAELWQIYKKIQLCKNSGAICPSTSERPLLSLVLNALSKPIFSPWLLTLRKTFLSYLLFFSYFLIFWYFALLIMLSCWAVFLVLYLWCFHLLSVKHFGQ